MQHLEFEPPEALRDTIRCFWYTCKELGAERSGFEVMPDGYAEIIFCFGSECSIEYRGRLQPLPSPFLIGLLDHPLQFYGMGTLEIVGIRCFPWTVFDLLGLPSDAGPVRTLEHPIAQLQARLESLMQVGRLEEAIATLRQYFEGEELGAALDPTLSKAGAAMREAGGTLPVRAVAEAAHATLRTLERKFRQSAGRSVKDVSGLIRFEQVRNRLWHDPGISLAGLAYELGYADQSHLSREFKRYSGTTPAVFARKARKEGIVAREFVAFVQA